MRKYDKPNNFFHNYEHSKEGRTHCKGPPSNPYLIKHSGGKHEISLQYAKGHGRTGTQWFKFNKKLGDGWELESGEKTKPLRLRKSRRIQVK